MIDAFPVVSPSRQAALADTYRALPLVDPAALPAWRAFADETMRQLDAIMAAGIDVMIDDTDPYASAAEMMIDVHVNGRIRVLGTHVTGSHPVLSDAVNDAFRAIHDVLGHAATGRGFDRHGEEAAYRAHARLYRDPLARMAMATETRGQNAALIYSTDGATFDVQRVAILPARWRTAHALAPSADERPAAMAQAWAFHAAAALGMPASADPSSPIVRAVRAVASR